MKPCTVRSWILQTLTIILLAPATTPETWAQSAEEAAPYLVKERGPHHRVWQRVTAETNALGRVQYRTNSYTELATGMHYYEAGQWKESRAEIVLTTEGAAATNGAHKVFFAANINTEGAVDLTTPEGQRLRSHVMGLAYQDAATGSNVLIAELKDAEGLLLPTGNQVLYTNAFTDFTADLRYTYTKSGFEQDVILRQQPPPPESFGLNPQTTRLQVWTEFFDAPTPTKQARSLGRRVALTNETLRFGTTRIGDGRAFDFEGGRKKSVPVGKRWLQVGSRQFLIEEVEFPRVENVLDALPRAQTNASINRPANARTAWALPPQPKSSDQSASAIRLAGVIPTQPGLVMDYVIISGSEEEFTFQGDTTYYVSDYFDVGTGTFEGGAVIKHDMEVEGGIGLGTVNCRTDSYRPVIFTATDDDSVGETIAGSSGVVGTNSYGGVILVLFESCELNNFHFRHGEQAIWAYAPITLTVRNSQFLNCYSVLYCEDTDFSVYNVLMGNVVYPFYGTFFNGDVQHLTLNGAYQFAVDEEFGSTIDLVNSLVVGNLAYNGVTLTTNHSQIFSSSSGLFASAGAGHHYLASSSTNRNAGTTNLNADLLASLKKMTTYPPLVWSNLTVSADTNLWPQVSRDTNSFPDLGYHFPALDWALNGVVVATGKTLTLTGGVTVATFGRSGIELRSSAKLISEGFPTNLNRIVGYHAV